jgi:hypothetical protein
MTGVKSTDFLNVSGAGQTSALVQAEFQASAQKAGVVANKPVEAKPVQSPAWAGWASAETASSVSQDTKNVRASILSQVPGLTAEQIARFVPDANVKNINNMTADVARLQLASQGYDVPALKGMSAGDINKAHQRASDNLAGQYAEIKAQIDADPSVTPEQRSAILNIIASGAAQKTSQNVEIRTAFQAKPAVASATPSAGAPADAGSKVQGLLSFLGLATTAPATATAAAQPASLQDILQGVGKRALADLVGPQARAA